MDPFVDRPRRVSLDDIACEIGISKATVCRALLGRARVASSTRQKVQEAARRLGYRPDPALSALTKHRWAVGSVARASYQVALIRVLGLDAPKGRAMSSSVGTTVSGVRERCSELGLALSERILEHEHSPRHLGRMLHHRGVDGLIFTIEGPVTSWDFPWEHFAAVTLGYNRHLEPTHAVVPDWFSAVTMAVSKVREAGYRRIGFASFKRRNPEIDDRMEAAIGLHRERLGLELGAQPAVFSYPLSHDASQPLLDRDRERFRAWYRAEQPDVVIDTNSLAHWWLRELGLEVPGDVGYATTLGDRGPMTPDLSRVSLGRVEQGRMAVELLFNLLQMNQRGLPARPVRMVVTCDWLSGSTLGSVPASHRSSPTPRARPTSP